jgi:RNA polymerase sigma factor (sigma-70 family)
MPAADLGVLMRRLRRAVDGAGHPAATDAEVLARFVARRDEAAFELLVWRHGPPVLALCRRLLRHEQDAEDAFQATFLVLARKAASVGRGQSVGSWLYKVAYRIALRLRERSTREAALPLDGRPEPARPAPPRPDDDVRAALDEEVGRLPDKYRAAVVLCYLEGKTNAEAARELGCPRGTVDSRLAWARQRLRHRLQHRGVGLCVAAILGRLTAAPAQAAVPAELARTTAGLALSFSAPGAAKALAAAPSVHLARGVLRAMLLAKVKWVSVLVLALAGTTAGSWGLLRTAGAAPAGAGAQQAAPEPGPAGRLPEEQAETWQVEATLHCRGPVACVTFAPDGRRLAAGAGGEGSTEGELTLWDVAAGRELLRVRADRAVRSVSFAPDGAVLATAEPGSAAKLRDPRTGRVTGNVPVPAGSVGAVAFSPDGRRLAAAAGGEVVWVLERAPDALKPVAKLAGEGPVSAIAFSPDGRELFTSGDDSVRVWDTTSGKLRLQLRGHRRAVASLAVTPDGRLVVPGGDGTVRVWDVATGKELRQLGVREEAGGVVAVSPDGKALAAADGAGAVVLLDLTTGWVLARLGRGLAGAIQALAFSPDGKRLAVAGRDGTVTIWRRGPGAAAQGAGLVADRLDQLLDHLLRTDRSDERVAEALYLATLGRLPTEGEKGGLAKAEGRSPEERRRAFEGLLGVLTASDEFRTHVEALRKRGSRPAGY